MRETATLHHIMLECGHGAVRLYRNNVGAYELPNGEWVRYGVANPGGSDLIGWRSTVITPEMVGSRFARFVAMEVKAARGRTRADQQRFMDLVREHGGIAGVARSPAEAEELLDMQVAQV